VVAAAGAWLLFRPADRVTPAGVAPGAGAAGVVEVENGTGRRGLARAATRQLRQAGFDVIAFGSAADSAARTEVIVRRGDSTLALRAIKVLGAGRVRLALDTLLRIDLTVRLGADYRPPPGFRP
jgi:hypothetical protein